MNHAPLESPDLPIPEPPSVEAVFVPCVTEERVWQIAMFATMAVHLGALFTAFLIVLAVWAWMTWLPVP